MRKYFLLAAAAGATLALVGCDRPTPTEPTADAPPAADASAAAGAPAAGTAPAGVADGTDARAASAATPGAPAQVSASYDCEGKPVAAAFDNTAQTVTLQIAAETLTLPSAMAGSGARYADDKGNEFWEHQGEAQLTLAGGKSQTCREADAPAG